jgi:hypothetical protein
MQIPNPAGAGFGMTASADGGMQIPNPAGAGFGITASAGGGMQIPNPAGAGFGMTASLEREGGGSGWAASPPSLTPILLRIARHSESRPGRDSESACKENRAAPIATLAQCPLNN